MRKSLPERISTINIGKNGLTENVIKEINFQLEKRGVVKVKLLRSFRESTGRDRKELAREVEKNINGRLVSLRGMVLTFVK
ncbi:putative RNA-binding protein containing KH domain, possibly ribosomal protein [Archaeoglobus sulfaticallidus PM70-1]|uniref:Putative RNA-binding protein containing KH domain, possibly ribosomal protein n=1 Tax=Archaeoglobus sulfaticallidus PM70-1 TaxID=387631 RepID=N0BI41_9EURY|nr:YhbY family RNA-binding protein [Archaeoglobus sulfaticallidus]AGK60111.1 putative RNA-binding protein containing KH domain, possibly ribosomal protein [Archaeoglobus sulfaticallidus PM70-1]